MLLAIAMFAAVALMATPAESIAWPAGLVAQTPPGMETHIFASSLVVLGVAVPMSMYIALYQKPRCWLMLVFWFLFAVGLGVVCSDSVMAGLNTLWAQYVQPHLSSGSPG